MLLGSRCQGPLGHSVFCMYKNIDAKENVFQFTHVYPPLRNIGLGPAQDCWIATTGRRSYFLV